MTRQAGAFEGRASFSLFARADNLTVIVLFSVDWWRGCQRRWPEYSENLSRSKFTFEGTLLQDSCNIKRSSKLGQEPLEHNKKSGRPYSSVIH